ncbi:hypothetical protein OV203_45505 [Nannocystis sp. ILAH1]|uniref:hypothetical protein n=1 Tax=unclassified Nannocystis TaxID=2627009 RepID=UPI00226EECE3|nr:MULTISPECIES: hypothetical protein [unclassified Nannocystis]MCY0994466.1 hypothetical protein [Nannocystis sp. ILAH1]MCY1063552.1 hypothetical protein [Nannocystis sp. RBIL2]
MPLDPPTSGRAPSPELLRLAAEGARNIERADQRQLELGDNHMRVALGAHYGSARQRALYVPMLVGGGLVAAMAAGFISVDYLTAGMAVLLPGLLGVAFLDPVAGDARVASERDWLAARPFPVRGYFEALQQRPVAGAVLLTQVRFAGETPPLDLVQGVLGRIDANPSVRSAGGRDLVLQSGLVSGATGIRINKVPVYRNHRIVPYVHRLVDEVLAPLHATYPIDQVELTRPV